MMSSAFPGCCTARIFHDFERGQEWDGVQPAMPDIHNSLKNDISSRLTLLKQSGYGTVVAITTHFQTNAEAVLTELGFYVVEGGEKRLHNQTKTSTWIMPLNEWEPT